MMKSVRVAVCDDDEFTLSLVADKVSSVFKDMHVISLVDKFSDGGALLAKIRNFSYDLVLLDISMPSADGLTVASKIISLGKGCEIAFVSNREDMAAKTFAVHPFAFIRKGNLASDLGEALACFARRFFSSDNTLCVRMADRGQLNILYSRIMYVESCGHKQLIYTSDRPSGEPVAVMVALKDMSADLTSHDIVQVHKSFFVNLRYIRRIDRKNVVLSDATSLPVSRNKAGEIKKIFMDYISRGGNFVLSEDGQ